LFLVLGLGNKYLPKAINTPIDDTMLAAATVNCNQAGSVKTVFIRHQELNYSRLLFEIIHQYPMNMAIA